MTLLKLENVTKRFSGLVAVNNVSLELHEGEILGMIGPNGAGKTTLFHSICGYHVPTEGKITLRGQEIQGKKPEVICGHGISRTFQIVQPFGNLTLLENVMVGAFNQVSKFHEAEKLAEKQLRYLGMSHKMHERMKDLTFAEQKKVEVARALATNPKILFLDEVMSGLNPTEVNDFIALIKEIRDNGTTIFFIEHLMSAVMQLSDRVVVMHLGEKIAEGSPHEVTKDPLVMEAYLGEEVTEHA
ncbi:ABC transporter ATP-binding protein [Solibacillus sp. FSL W7-1464]|uniref:ABC transporter ATP-binding protein n=1 Tax=Solibacillus sp. FSL W7-1464 TaxID=2921706 RepID=UPI0030FCE5D9